MSKEIPEEVKFIEERRAMIDPMLERLYKAGLVTVVSPEYERSLND